MKRKLVTRTATAVPSGRTVYLVHPEGQPDDVQLSTTDPLERAAYIRASEGRR